MGGLKIGGKLARGYEEIRAAIASAVAPFGKSGPAQKKRRKERAARDLRYFAETYFPHYLTCPPSRMHGELFEKFQELVLLSERTGEGGRDAEAAPRGNAKSTVASLILPLWCVAGYRRRFIGMVSDTTEQAAEFLEFIKAELEINERLLEDFPEICGEGRTWKAGHVVTANGVKIKCWGKRKRIRGARHGSRRPDLVICDDLEDDESVESPEQREKDRKWFFKALMKVGARYTVYVVVGTILHYDSLLARLLKQPGWTGKKYKAVIKFSPSPLWQEWERLMVDRRPEAGEDPPLAKSPHPPFTKGGQGGISEVDRFFEAHREEMLAGTEVLWPEAEDYYYLMKMRVAEGPAFFDSEKQNEPVNPDDCLFQESWFAYWDDIEAPIPFPGGAWCSVDPSMGRESRRADPSAILIGALRPDGRIDILEADIRKRHPDAIMEDLFRYHQVYSFERVVVEEVQFQELFKDNLVKEGARRGIYLPVEGTRPTADKALRIAKLQPHIKNGLIRFRRDQRILLDQLKYFPKADHDDGPDALEMLFHLVASAKRGPRVRTIG